MLPWQQSMLDQWDTYSVDHPVALRRKALVLAFSIYALLCLLFFIPHVWHASPVTVVIKGATLPVIFMSQGDGKRKRSVARRLQQVKKGAPAPVPKKEIPKPIIKAPESKKPEPKKIELPTRKSVVKEQKPAQKSKQELKREAQKAQAVAQAKKLEEAKKAAAVKKALAQKAVEEKKAKKAPEKPANKPIEKQPEKIEDALQEKIQEDAVVEVDDGVTQDGPENIVIGQDEQGLGDGDTAVLKSHMALSAAIMRVWRPPYVQIESPVHAAVEIDAYGVVKGVQLETKSGIVAYDIAARAAVLRTDFPKEFWGRAIVLVFGA